ncbi:hypothetical protein XENOCAPTIV_024649 [Xenoophorus captivus]|uniref:Uncharacterized protein n=1 Tax=Xenoophorus captivus TaxID=1517983 RepID=A0ABV0QKQ6_9TELE
MPLPDRMAPRAQSRLGYLKTSSALINVITNHFPNPLHDTIDDLFPDGVMASSVVVGCILFSRDQLLRVEELSVLSDPHFIWREKLNSDQTESNWVSKAIMSCVTELLTDYRGLQVYEECPGNVTPRTPSVEESVERIFTGIWSHRALQENAIRTDAVLEAEELPACISSLNTCLAHMDGDALSLWRECNEDGCFQ